MPEFTCNKCGDEITYKNYHSKYKCKKCEKLYQQQYQKNNKEKINEYNKYYQKTQRWLNGCDNYDDMGEALPVRIKSVNGVCYV